MEGSQQIAPSVGSTGSGQQQTSQESSTQQQPSQHGDSARLIEMQQQQRLTSASEYHQSAVSNGDTNGDSLQQHDPSIQQQQQQQQQPPVSVPLLSASSFQPTPLSGHTQNPNATTASATVQPPTQPTTGAVTTTAVYPSQAEEVYQFILDLTVASKRERALLELSRRRESFADLAPILWHSFGSITAVLQEIVSIYPQLSPPTLTSVASNRVCNALALLQCVASHSDTRHHFLNAHIPLFLYPFLNTVSVSRPFEYLRLTSLGVIGALVKVDDHEVIGFLLQTEIISLCLRIMEMGSELSKTVATFIVQKILLDELGLRYICATAERFYALSSVLGGMVHSLVEQPSPRLIKHIVKCYLRLADNQRAREALKRCLPAPLRQGPLLNVIKEDPTTKQNIATLIELVDNTPNGQLFDMTSATDLLAQAHKQQKLQQQQQQLQQALQGVVGSNLQAQQAIQQRHQAFQQQKLQEALQNQQLSAASLLNGGLSPGGLGSDGTGLPGQ